MELDIEHPDALLDYLRHTDRIGMDEDPRITVLAGGVSNRTVLVERTKGEAWVLKQALTQLRVAVDWFSSPERIHREASGLRTLPHLVPHGTIPALIFEDHTQHIVAMAAVPLPHENWKSMLLAGRLEQTHIEQWGRLLGSIHRHAYEQRDEFAADFVDCSFFESLRIEPYYGYTATQIPQAAHFIDMLINETRQQRVTLVHGDYSPKNILIVNNRLILLDHEVIHWGDPAFDLGFSLTHLLSKAHHLHQLRDVFAQAANVYWQVYHQMLDDLPWTTGLEARAVRHTIGCLLARVAGRSPLEYLTPDEQSRQRDILMPLLAHTPQTIPDMIDQFVTGLNHDAYH